MKGRTKDRQRRTNKANTPSLTHASFFSGIGGFDLGFEKVGFSTTYQCEIDPFCASVLQRHWPNIERGTDVRLETEIPEARVWTAGFPCQDVSLARGNHKRPGFKGRNSSLFFDFHELVEKEAPEIVVIENVVGLLSSNHGKDFYEVVRRFVRSGYAVSWRSLNTRYYGAPQSRKRVFFCAWKGSIGKAIGVLHDAAPAPDREKPAIAFKEAHQCGASGAIVPRISYCIAATSGRHTGNDWSRTYVSYSDRVRRPTPRESEALQGFPADWTIPTADFRIPARGIDSERYKSIGNAVSVPAAIHVAKRIITPDRFEFSGDRIGAKKLVDAIRAEARIFPNASRMRSFAMTDLEHSFTSAWHHKWQDGGFADANSIVDFISPEWGSPVNSLRFVEVLEQTTLAEKFFLSKNAAEGMLSRARTVGRKFFPPMEIALRRIVGARITNEQRRWESSLIRVGA
jgi:DNA (cytosine-5)-methyltransferase 1